MQAFLNYYIKEHSLTSITTIDLRQTWEFFIQKKSGLDGVRSNEVLASVNWELWMFGIGTAPQGNLNFDTSQADLATELALEYISLNGTASPDSYLSYNDFYSNLKVVFHNTLEANIDSVTIAILEKIDADYNCTGDIDPEVRQRWYPIGIDKDYQPVYDPAHEWISSMGRIKYLTPVYTALQISNQCTLANTWFDENKDFYHPLAVNAVQDILDKCTAPTEPETDFFTEWKQIMKTFGTRDIGFLN